MNNKYITEQNCQESLIGMAAFAGGLTALAIIRRVYKQHMAIRRGCSNIDKLEKKAKCVIYVNGLLINGLKKEMRKCKDIRCASRISRKISGLTQQNLNLENKLKRLF